MGTESGLRRRVSGLSEAEFWQRFGTEEACRAALFQLRWGKGWACPGCGHGGYAELKGRAVYQCNRCKRQVGLTGGTVFHWTKLPLTTWFLAIYHLSQSKGAMSSVDLARRLGTRQPTAWLMKHKLMAAMQARDVGKPSWPAGSRSSMPTRRQRPGGERGRGAAGGSPLAAQASSSALCRGLASSFGRRDRSEPLGSTRHRALPLLLVEHVVRGHLHTDTSRSS